MPFAGTARFRPRRVDLGVPWARRPSTLLARCPTTPTHHTGFDLRYTILRCLDRLCAMPGVYCARPAAYQALLQDHGRCWGLKPLAVPGTAPAWLEREADMPWWLLVNQHRPQTACISALLLCVRPEELQAGAKNNVGLDALDRTSQMKACLTTRPASALMHYY